MSTSLEPDKHPEPPSAEPEVDEEQVSLPPPLAKSFAWTWRAITKTNVGFFTMIALIYVIPYGLAVAAITTQVGADADFLILGYAALIASCFVASQPLPTPGMGTISMVLAGLLGANFDPVVAGFVAATAQTLGLLTSYGAGAAGLAPVITERYGSNSVAAAAITRGTTVIRKHGATAMLVLAAVPNPLYAWASVFAGASGTRFKSFLGASFVGGSARFLVCAFIGEGILKYF
jgi:membrane protein DedA with SNARE-associated domain